MTKPDNWTAAHQAVVEATRGHDQTHTLIWSDDSQVCAISRGADDRAYSIYQALVDDYGGDPAPVSEAHLAPGAAVAFARFVLEGEAGFPVQAKEPVGTGPEEVVLDRLRRPCR